MKNLSAEILQQVNKYLEREDLLQCQVTTQNWFLSASEKLYRHIKMRNINDAQLFMASLETKPILGTYVKTVYIESPGNHRYWDAEDFLDFIVTFCPYISSISFQPEYRDAYWENHARRKSRTT